jgi:hypothetical protein
MNKIGKKSIFIEFLHFEAEMACKLSEVNEENEEESILQRLIWRAVIYYLISV